MKNIYEYRICCFIDILGFKNHLDETLHDDGNDSIKKIEEIKSVIDLANSILKEMDNGIFKSKMVTQFSDSIVLSFKIEEKSGVFDALINFLHVGFEFANKGFLTRGGIAVGKLIHTSKHIFGPALVEAYTLESRIANFPRIILHPDVLEVAKHFPSKHNSSKDELESVHACLSKDEDEYYYIDYIEKVVTELDDHNYGLVSYLGNLKSTILNGLKSDDSSIIDKIEWLRKKYNNYILKIQSNTKDRENIDGDYELLAKFRSLETI